MSISTMSSSEFDLESVASESSYADYVDKLRVKPASLPDVPHFNRPFEQGERRKEFRGRTSGTRSLSGEPSQRRTRHSFEPQSRTRAIQLMRGEPVDTMVPQEGREPGKMYSETQEDEKAGASGETQADVRFKQRVGEYHSGVTEHTMEATMQSQSEMSYSDKYTETKTYTESRESVSMKEEASLRESPRPKPVKSVKERFLSDTVMPEGITRDLDEPYEEEPAEESLKAQYEKSLDADRMECEEKLLALRIRKWQKGMRMSEEETFEPETDLPVPAEPLYMEPEEHVYAPKEVLVEKRTTVEAEASPTSSHKSPRMKARLADPEPASLSIINSPKMKVRAEEVESSASLLRKSPRMKASIGEMEFEASTMVTQKSPRMNVRAAEMEAEASPRMKARAEKPLFEKTREERELQLSRENISELKSEGEQFASEEEALNQRIMKWQQDVLIEQEQAVKMESDWVGPYSPYQPEKTAEAKRGDSASDPVAQPVVAQHRRTSPEKTAKDKFPLSESVPTGFQDEQDDRLHWPPAELPTEGRETRLHTDSEYFVSEEEALAQRILKWQQDGAEQEEVAELESDWALDEQYKQPGTGLPFDSHVPPFDTTVINEPTTVRKPSPTPLGTYGPTSQQEEPPHTKRKPSQLLHAAAYESSPPKLPCESSPLRRHSPTHSGLPYHAGVPVESLCDLPSSPVKDRMDGESTRIRRHSPTQLASELASAQAEIPHKLSRESSPVRRRSPCRSTQEDPQRGMDRRRCGGEYSVTVDKDGTQRFQADVRDERWSREEIGSSGESNERRRQMDLKGVRGESSGQRRDDSLELGAVRKEDWRPQECDKTAKGPPPVFVKEMSSIKVKIGEMSEFTCKFQGDPQPTVTWLKDGHPLAHNPDYDIMSKSNESKLTVYYPTTDHEGTFDCVITNKHGKTICSATLEISDMKLVRTSDVTQKVMVTEDLEEGEGCRDSLIVKEPQSYTDTGKATLQVPEAMIHIPRRSDESFTSSPVQIRITAATPVPEMMEEGSEVKPEAIVIDKVSDVPSDEGASQTVKHKFTFSFDVVGEPPRVVSELENVGYSEGETAVLECVITGEPAPEITWYHDEVSIKITTGKYRVEEHEKCYRLYIYCFTYTDAGVYKCVAQNKLGEVTSISDVSFQIAEPTQFSEAAMALVGDVLTPSPTSTTGRVRKSPVCLADNIKKPALSYTAKVTDTDITEETHQSISSHTPRGVAAKEKIRPGVYREPPGISGCGLQASAAVIKVSQIKQAFESDSPVPLMPSPPPEEQTKQTIFPEEFIPPVAGPLDQQEQTVAGELKETAKCDAMFVEGSGSWAATTTLKSVSPETVGAEPIPASGKPVSSAKPKSVSSKTFQPISSLEEDREVCMISGVSEEGAALVQSHSEIKQFVEEVQESPQLVRPKPVMAGKPVHSPEQMGVAEVEETVREETVHMFDRTSSFIPFHCDKVPAVKRSTGMSDPGSEVVKPKRVAESLSAYEKPMAAARSIPFSGEVQDASLEVQSFSEEMKHVNEGMDEELVSMPKAKHVNEGDKVVSVVPEPSLDSGVFLSIPDSQADVTDMTEEIEADSVVEPSTYLENKGVDVEAEPSVVKPKTDSTAKPPGLGDYIASQGPQKQALSKQGSGDVDQALAEAGVVGGRSMEVEEVTFGAVYDYYNPPTDWGRPLSPESEMSIEIGSTFSEEIADVAERFYTPASSTEISQPIAASFRTPKSPESFNTPTTDTGGFMTPHEYPFSPIEHKRPSTGDSSERFFSPAQFLRSPADEGVETTPPSLSLEDSRYLTEGRGSLGLGTLQEKVQGIPPAFLKPLTKKRVFENDSLTFYAEVFGLPSPEVKWFRNKTRLVADDRVKMDRDGDNIALVIHNITKADQGEYICEAVNYVGEARSVALVVVVSQEVRFMPAPPAVTHQHVMEFDVEEDDSSRSPSPQEILLEVELDENDVKEFERQVKIITIPEYSADNKSMIISLDVLPSMYEEGAVDFVTQENDDLKIAFEVIEMPPRFINPICDMETPESTTVMFECSLMGIPSPIISWFKGDRKIPHDNKKYLHSSDGDNHFLKICKVTTQDSGVYTCRAINVVGETLCRASLSVLSAKAFSGKARGRELTAVSLGSAKLQPQKFDLMVGNTSFDGEQTSEIELEFEFEQEPDESQRAVRLVANTDNEMSEQGEKYVSINFDVFAEPAKDDKIEFKGKSSETCSFQFQVTETPPKCIIPLTNVTAAVGTPVILQCLFSGKPNPTAEWYKDGDRVTDSRCIIQEKTAGHFNLLITNGTQSDAGEYKCVIQNQAGCVETTALLKVF